MITIDTLNNAEELEILSLAKQSGKNAGQMAADIIREYLEDRHDAMLADKALAEIQSGKSSTVPWKELKECLYEGLEG